MKEVPVSKNKNIPLPRDGSGRTSLENWTMARKIILLKLRTAAKNNALTRQEYATQKKYWMDLCTKLMTARWCNEEQYYGLDFSLPASANFLQLAESFEPGLPLVSCR